MAKSCLKKLADIDLESTTELFKCHIVLLESREVFILICEYCRHTVESGGSLSHHKLSMGLGQPTKRLKGSGSCQMFSIVCRSLVCVINRKNLTVQQLGGV